MKIEVFADADSVDRRAAALVAAEARAAVAVRSPAVFDLIHWGLGPDEHTASLVPAKLTFPELCEPRPRTNGNSAGAKRTEK